MRKNTLQTKLWNVSGSYTTYKINHTKQFEESSAFLFPFDSTAQACMHYSIVRFGAISFKPKLTYHQKCCKDYYSHRRKRYNGMLERPLVQQQSVKYIPLVELTLLDSSNPRMWLNNFPTIFTKITSITAPDVNTNSWMPDELVYVLISTSKNFSAL